MRQSAALPTRSAPDSFLGTKVRNASFTLEESTRDPLDLQPSSKPRPASAVFRDDLEEFLRVAREEDRRTVEADCFRGRKLLSKSMRRWEKYAKSRVAVRTLDAVLTSKSIKSEFSAFISLRKFAFFRERSVAKAERYYQQKLVLKAMAGWSRVMMEKYHVLEVLGTSEKSHRRKAVKIVERRTHFSVASFGNSPEKEEKEEKEGNLSGRFQQKAIFHAFASVIRKKIDLNKKETELQNAKLQKRYFLAWFRVRRRIESNYHTGLRTIAAFLACYKLQKSFIHWRSTVVRGSKQGNPQFLTVSEAKTKLKSMSDEDLILEISQLEATLSGLREQVTRERSQQHRMRLLV